MSKGSKQRPTDKQKFDEGWDRIFGPKSKDHNKIPENNTTENKKDK